MPQPYEQPQSQQPPTVEYARPGAAPQDETVATIIPYRNWQALTSYYLGLFSLFPLLGAILGIAAVILGILGLRAVRRDPAVKGTAHAIIGIVCGTLFGGIWLLVLIFVAGVALMPQ